MQKVVDQVIVDRNIHRWSFGVFFCVYGRRICLIWKIWKWISALCVSISVTLCGAYFLNRSHLTKQLVTKTKKRQIRYDKSQTGVRIVLKRGWLQKSRSLHIDSGHQVKSSESGIETGFIVSGPKMSKFCSSPQTATGCLTEKHHPTPPPPPLQSKLDLVFLDPGTKENHPPPIWNWNSGFFRTTEQKSENPHTHSIVPRLLTNQNWDLVIFWLRNQEPNSPPRSLLWRLCYAVVRLPSYYGSCLLR